MKVLVFGGSGQLGLEIVTGWRDDTIVAPSHAEAPLENPSALEAVIANESPDLVVNCAAFHNVDVCESEAERAFAINALGVDAMARECQRRDVAFVTVSTDYVFDGEAERPYEEVDCPSPISAYGVSKLAGELLVGRRSMDAFVVRTSGVYGKRASRSKGHTFIDRILGQARSGEEIRVVNDVVASPTYAADLADAVHGLVSTGAYGLYHAVNTGAVSWYDFARKALQLAGLPPEIRAISRNDWVAPARRPRYSALSNAKLASLGVVMPSWEEGIRSYLAAKAMEPEQ